MQKLLTLLMFSIGLLNSQINHQDKLVIKRKLGESTVTVDFDGRTNETGFYHKHIDFGVAYPLQQSWIVELKYRAQYRTKEDTWSLEHRPQFQLIKNINRPSVKWQLRTRMEYRIREGKEDEMRNRSRIQIKAPKPMSSLKITPFINNESFFAPETWKHYINWVSFGFDLPKSKIGKPTIFYKYVITLIEGEWVPTYTFVFKLTI